MIVLSPDIIREIPEVIHRPELRQRFPEMAEPARIDLILSRLQEAEVVEPIERLTVCRDPNDDKFVECANAGHANYIVSEDQDIFAIQEYRGIRTISAAGFMSVITAQQA